MAYFEGEESIRRGRVFGGQAAVRTAQQLRRENLGGRRPDTIAKSDTKLAYSLPSLDPVGPYLTCGDCGGQLVPNRHGVHRCAEGPSHAAARSPSPEQIAGAKRLLADALLQKAQDFAAERGRELSYEEEED